MISYPAYRSSTVIVIPSMIDSWSVTAIAAEAFKGSDMTSLTIPGTVVTIGAGAFENCTALAVLDLQSGIQRLEAGTFKGCTALTEVTIPASVTYLSGFEGCTALTSVTVPNTVSVIGTYAFKGCTALKNMTCY